MPFANAWALREPGEVISTALTQGRRTTGNKIVAPALVSLSSRRAEVQNRREWFRDPSIRWRSKILKCFGSPPVREANHKTDQSHCPYQIKTLPSRLTRQVPVVEQQRIVTTGADSWFGNDFRRLAGRSADCFKQHNLVASWGASDVSC